MIFLASMFVVPRLYMLLIYVAAAVGPAGALMYFIYRQDQYEKEPPKLLGMLILAGVFSALSSIVLETIAQLIIDRAVNPYSYKYPFVLAFLGVAVIEEGTKFLFLYDRTWHNGNFNYRFDGIVYAVFVSLGFAAFENVEYVFNLGLSVALPRAILSIPGHMAFSVFMGYFYGRAKHCEKRGKYSDMVMNSVMGYISSVLLHGVYDSCLMAGTTISMIFFIFFVITVYVIVFLLVRHESKTDRRI